MVSNGVVSATQTSLVTAFVVAKRAVESSSSSTSSGKKAKCTGSKSDCQKPSDTNAVTVGVAVAVPVGCVLILFMAILWVVYRRNKREAQEDHDPDFEGDTEFLPTMKRNNGYSQSSHSGESHAGKEWAADDESYMPRNHQFRNSAAVRSVQARNLDPFFLPEANDNSLRDFARQLQNDELGPYRIVSNTNSRATSQVSLPYEKNEVRVSQNVGSSSTAYTSPDARLEMSDATPNSVSTSSSDPPLDQSPVKSTAGEATRRYVDDLSGLEAEHSKLDSTFDNQNSHTMAVNASRETFNFEKGNVLNQLDDSTRAAEPDEDDHVIPMTTKEEEDIQRMKSVYKVYLDRDGTVRQKPLDQSEFQDDEDYQDAPTQPLDLAQTQSHLETPSDAQRIASSIYSAAPVPEDTHNPGYYQSDYNSAQQYPYQQQNVAPEGYGQSYEYQQQYNYQQQYPPQGYHMPFPQQQQYAHPQTLESIGELPTPTNLPFSTSSHSLTSFKQTSKQPQLAQLQAARINGTAVNPMDHPQMFYTQGNDSYSSYQSATGTLTGQPAAPYQLRQSVVMTNPSDLTAAPKFRPAGSIRTASAANTRNNTMTSRMNPYYQQQQAYNSRVSGLLNAEDVTQPPSVGQILPHSGSHEDLRRQIGTSHNYNVV